ncbi:unnamed protein product [Bursaphelenchus xylophilus]|uniref:Aminopeptidase n=1 Tax=Bursaphelenchus xylophilus TaxID=6326 RepID=A0A1I7RVL9_BURXY|nr:unnamed protein product [Bursaphelenchus xylophilus]CAG9081869.1 unnamed protein product [Bursaphelenchus xylophilus]
MLKYCLFLLLFCSFVYGLKPILRKDDGSKPFQPLFAHIDHTNDSLPHTVEVYHYNLTLDPTFAFKGYKFPEDKLNTFTGSVHIVLSVSNQTNEIELNSAVNITSIHLTDGATEYKITKQEHTKEDHLILTTDKALEVSKNLTLSFEFNGKIGNSGDSIYYVDYVDDDNEKTALVATLFEEIKARTVFPCFDDPSFKSTFQVTLHHPKGSKALSNEYPISETDAGAQAITVFNTTVKMPTYLLAFAIGNFTEMVADSSIVYTTYKDPLRTLTTATFSSRFIEVLEQLTGVKYPLDKLGHLDARTLSAGAMENYGLIIYTGGLLVAPYLEDLAHIYKRVMIVAHETSHQWFGNLVTAKRWGLEYLHESFATFFQTELFQDIGHVKYAAKLEFIRQYYAVRDIAKDASHAIEDNKSQFDDITYGVGGTILASIKNLLTEEVFYKALNIYLTENRFGNADTDTLAGAFDKALQSAPPLGFNFTTEYLYPYIRQVGIPTVNVTLNEQGQYVIEQTPFRGSTTWLVPLFAYNLDKLEEIRVDIRTDPVILNTTDTLLFNSEFKTFAFVELDEKVQKKVREHKNIVKLSPVNQILVLNEYGDREKVFERIAQGYDYIIDPLLADFINDLTDEHTIYSLMNNWVGLDTVYSRILARPLFTRGVKLEVENVVNRTQAFFNEFEEMCAPDQDLFYCSYQSPEVRYGIFAQGAKSEEGRKFLEDYRERLQKHPQARLFEEEIKRVDLVL